MSNSTDPATTAAAATLKSSQQQQQAADTIIASTVSILYSNTSLEHLYHGDENIAVTKEEP
jgi:hypothetical protein